MAGLSGYATSDPIEARGEHVDIQIQNESFTVPNGYAIRAFLHAENGTLSVYRSGAGTASGEEIAELEFENDGQEMWLGPDMAIGGNGGLLGFKVPL